MEYKIIKAVLIGFMLNISNIATAGIINFNVAESDFTIKEFKTDEFIIKPTADGLASLGTDRDNSAFTGKNGRLISWSNTGLTSGFTLETISNDLFSLQSFQSGNGYVDGSSPVKSLTLQGLLFDGSLISEDFEDIGKINLSSMWDNLVSVEFIAHGLNNRAYWDSIKFETFAAPTSVSEPSAFIIFIIGLLSLTARRFNKM